MNKRGSLEWSLETVGKLVFYALVLVAVIWMSIKLIDLFTNGERDWRVKQNLYLLDTRIKFAQKSGQQQSVILQIPQDYVFIGFDTTMPVDSDVRFRKVSRMGDLFTGRIFADIDVIVKRPRCGDACICAYRFDSGLNWTGTAQTPVSTTSEQVVCKEIKGVKTIIGSWEKVAWTQEDLGADMINEVSPPIRTGGERVLAFGGNLGAVDVNITVKDNTLILSQVMPSVGSSSSSTIPAPAPVTP